MSRQRVINEYFWDDPDLTEYTVETRFTLLMFLTNRFSNIIGIYRVNWRTLGASVGWSREQTINAALLVETLGGIRIDVDSGWVWVLDWWKHNSIKGALTGNVAKKASAEVQAVPEVWRNDLTHWLLQYDSDGACKGLIKGLQGSGANTNPNNTFISNPTALTYPQFLTRTQQDEIKRLYLDWEELQLALDELVGANQRDKVKDPVKLITKMYENSIFRTPEGEAATSARLRKAP